MQHIMLNGVFTFTLYRFCVFDGQNLRFAVGIMVMKVKISDTAKDESDVKRTILFYGNADAVKCSIYLQVPDDFNVPPCIVSCICIS